MAFLFLLPAVSGWSLSTPDEYLDVALRLQQDAQSVQNLIFGFLDSYHDLLTASNTKFPIEQTFTGADNNVYKIVIDLANIPTAEKSREYYDKAATLYHIAADQKETKIANAFWQTKKTGILPGPESLSIQASLQREDQIQNFDLRSEERHVDGNEYFRSLLKFSISTHDSKPIERGVAEIFQDVQRQQTKLSASIIEGPSDIPPKEMTQVNIQAIVGAKGYIFLREDQSDPTNIPKNQKHFCQNTQGGWVSQNSREWDENCLSLFDKSEWHGFSYDSLPYSYKPFLN